MILLIYYFYFNYYNYNYTIIPDSAVSKQSIKLQLSYVIGGIHNTGIFFLILIINIKSLKEYAVTLLL